MHNGPKSGLAVKSLERKQTQTVAKWEKRLKMGTEMAMVAELAAWWTRQLGSCLESYGRETAMWKSHLLFVVCLVRAIMST